MKPTVLPRLMALSIGFIAAGAAQAASTTWSNIGTNFNLGTNWSGGLPGGADFAVFAGPASVQPELSSNITINALSFNTTTASGYELGGAGVLTLNSVATGTSSAIYSGNTSETNTINTAIVLAGAAGSTASFSVAAGGTLVVSGNISSTNAISGLRIEGLNTVGTVTLSGSNSYAGDTTLTSNSRTKLNINSAYAISSGKLIAEAAVDIDNTSGSAITLANNNNIDLGGTLRFAGTNDLSFGSGVLKNIIAGQVTVTVTSGTLAVGSIDASSIAGTFRKTGAGSLVISGSAGASFQGGTTLAAGVLAIGHTNALGTGALTVTSGTLVSSANLGGLNAISNEIILGGGFVISGSNHLGIAGGISQSSGARIVEVTNTATTTLSGTNNSYLGSTRLTGTAGILEVVKLADGGVNSSIGASGNGASNLLIGDGTTLRYIGSGDSTNRLFQISGAAGAVATLDASGSGAVAFTNTGALSHSSSNLARTLNLTGSNTGNNSLALTLANNGAGALSVSKNGTGTWVLAGANTYTGSTLVTTGRLVVAGSINNSSAVTVSGGGEFRYNSNSARTGAITLNGAGGSSRAILSGTGAINTAITLDNLGDTLSPGDGIGMQNFGVSQEWDSFTYQWEVNDFTGTTAGTHFDRIAITGGLTLDGSGTFHLDLRSLTGGNVGGNVANFSEIDTSWTILTTTGGITGFDAGNWTVLSTNFTSNPGWTGIWSISQSGNDLVLNYAAVPEPSTFGLMALGLAAGLVLVKRRRA